jgi:hypothetical protein
MLLEWEHSFSPPIRAARYTQLKYVIKSRQIFIATTTLEQRKICREFLIKKSRKLKSSYWHAEACVETLNCFALLP